MCGIVGYTGKSDALSPVLEGLRRLEYRGYDSAGIALSQAQVPSSGFKSVLGNSATLKEFSAIAFQILTVE
jgi:glucosamine 6-phosphate synthetase-like amidotransferase/phosphosugar isomerase protein